MKTYQFEKGEVLLINKPVGWTSFDVVNKIRYACKAKKVGHAGTLDPLASGLLIICTGKKTKEISLYQNLDKTYYATLVLGATRPSVDMETEIEKTYSIDNITNKQIHNVIKQFTGSIQQKPPVHSAVKVEGERSYNLARKGINPKLSERTVVISNIEVIDIELPEVTLIIKCEKGTYIRSLVRDIGKALGCGAYLKTLVRTGIGEYLLDHALEIDEFITHCKNQHQNQ